MTKVYIKCLIFNMFIIWGYDGHRCVGHMHSNLFRLGMFQEFTIQKVITLRGGMHYHWAFFFEQKDRQIKSSQRESERG